ncbi:MAG: response regulator [Actinomycetota bacterium]
MPKRSVPSGKTKPKLLIVDDHPLWRATLKQMFERGGIARVVAESGDGEDAIKQATKSAPEVVLMDMALPTLDGVAAMRAILELNPQTKILVLSSSEDRSDVLRAVRAGACGYMLKSAGSKEIVEALKQVVKGEMVFPPSVLDIVLNELRARRSGTPTISVAIVAPSVLDREGLTKILSGTDIEVESSAASPNGLTGHPDVVIVTNVSDASVVREHSAVLILAEQIDPSEAIRVLGKDVSGVGYMLRSRVSDLDQLTDAIRRVASGQTVVDPSVFSAITSGSQASPSLASLTERERDVLQLIAEGRSNAAICKQLYISSKTLERHISSIFLKLGLDETPDEHRRVLAVLTYLGTSSSAGS